jgi:hypothetical protein
MTTCFNVLGLKRVEIGTHQPQRVGEVSNRQIYHRRDKEDTENKSKSKQTCMLYFHT